MTEDKKAAFEAFVLGLVTHALYTQQHKLIDVNPAEGTLQISLNRYIYQVSVEMIHSPED